jgi:hypothetical protein
MKKKILTHTLILTLTIATVRMIKKVTMFLSKSRFNLVQTMLNLKRRILLNKIKTQMNRYKKPMGKSYWLKVKK